jgi:hypothetical protein
MKRFLVRYYNKGEWYGTSVYAEDVEDASQICKRHGLQLDGEHKFTICWPFGWIVELLMP